jgi:predicted glycoside hydrolase/deacetylase ChbG (UPF0249 family)
LNKPRRLIVIADDFGIGLPTSQGILDLAARGVVTGAVLLAHSPFAAESVQMWKLADESMELGWHPCLTLDRPILSPEEVPSLVDAEGRFYSLGKFLARLALGRVRSSEIAAELTAQYHRFVELVGEPPRFVNAHHHIAVFPPVGAILTDILSQTTPLPYVRRVREPWHLLAKIPGSRLKRLLLSLMGRREVFAGFPGNEWLAGITDPEQVHDPEYLNRWVRHTPGQVVELACHPGHLDESLIGRDCTATDGMVERRVREYQLLSGPGFAQAIYQAGFRLTPPSWLTGSRTERAQYVA